MTPTSDLSADALLAHAGWMRALAVGLVRDPNEADDVVQDAALAALLHPPPAGAALRPWLGAVVRNFAWRRRRAQARRSEHEGRASEPESGGDDASALERIELQRKLLDAVGDLPEALRTTVVQRYFEGRTSADIAHSAGVPAATVRARLKRGLEALRERLDREVGSRGAWMALMVPLVPREFAPAAAGAGTVSTTLVTQGVLTMTVIKIALVTTATVVAGLAWWNLAPEHAAPATRIAMPSAGVRAPGEPASAEVRLEPAEAAGERSVAAPAAEPEPAPTAALETEATPAPAVGTLDARLVDEGGAPWPGGDLAAYLMSRGDARELGRASSDTDGRVELTLELPSFAARPGGPAAANFVLVARRPGCAARRLEAVIGEGAKAHLGDVVLLEAALVRGRVLDEAGLAVAGASVGAIPVEVFEAFDSAERARFVRVGHEAFDPLLATAASADGGFELGDVAPGRVVLWAHAPGHRFAVSEPLELRARQAVDDVTIALPALQRSDRIAGQVVGPDGAGRPASLKRDMRRGGARRVDFLSTDNSGRFDFAVDQPESVYELTAMDGYSEFSSASAQDVRPGDLDVVIAFRSGREVLVRTLDEDGEPVEGLRLWVSDGASTNYATSREVAPGEHELDCPGGRFWLEASGAGWREARSATYEETSIPAVVEIVLERAPTVRGIVTAGGRPLAGATLRAHRFDPSGTMTVHGLRCTLSPFEAGEALSDAEGRFALAVDAEGPIVVRASAAGWADAESAPFELALRDPDEELELDLGHGGTIEGHVSLASGTSAGGIVVGVHRGDGRAISQRTAEDGTFRFEGLMPGDWQVLPLEAEIPAHGGSYASYAGDAPMTWNCRVEPGLTTRFDLTLD